MPKSTRQCRGTCAAAAPICAFGPRSNWRPSARKRRDEVRAVTNPTLMLTRRSFAFGVSAAAGGLVLTSTPLAVWAGAADVPDQRVTAPEVTIWVVIEPDDTTVIRVARSEMGQGSFTALPMLVAEELECDWSRVRAEYVDPRENVVKGRPWGDMVTAASLAIRGSQSYLRKAGAQARIMLISEAAACWGVDTTECSARDGVVRHTG